MSPEDEKIKIKDLGEHLINEPYEILIDINPTENYWETGMITKLNGKDVMIIECNEIKDWRKILPINAEDRAICRLLISEL